MTLTFDHLVLKERQSDIAETQYAHAARRAAEDVAVAESQYRAVADRVARHHTHMTEGLALHHPRMALLVVSGRAATLKKELKAAASTAALVQSKRECLKSHLQMRATLKKTKEHCGALRHALELQQKKKEALRDEAQLLEGVVAQRASQTRQDRSRNDEKGSSAATEPQTMESLAVSNKKQDVDEFLGACTAKDLDGSDAPMALSQSAPHVSAKVHDIASTLVHHVVRNAFEPTSEHQPLHSNELELRIPDFPGVVLHVTRTTEGAISLVINVRQQRDASTFSTLKNSITARFLDKSIHLERYIVKLHQSNHDELRSMSRQEP